MSNQNYIAIDNGSLPVGINEIPVLGYEPVL